MFGRGRDTCPRPLSIYIHNTWEAEKNQIGLTNIPSYPNCLAVRVLIEYLPMPEREVGTIFPAMFPSGAIVPSSHVLLDDNR